MRLYHRSNVAIEIPRLIGQTRGRDFGAGFYLTSHQVNHKLKSFQRLYVIGKKVETIVN
jgi:hypothetical protein